MGMRRGKDILARVLCAVMVFSLMAVNMQGKVANAAWIPDHTIPAYQQKDVYDVETATISGIKVEEVTNATANPVITKALEQPVKFVIFNSTKQEIEQEVTSENGMLPDLNLVKNHNYTIIAQDSEYRMNNVYVWVKNGNIVNIKEGWDEGQNIWEYPAVEGLYLYKRTTPNPNPSDERRVRMNVSVLTEGGGPLYNVKFKLVSDVETIETTSGENGKLQERLLEDVNYMVTVESDQWDVAPFPISVKDKSEYGAGKYTYDHSSCARIDEIRLVNKGEAHKDDSVLTNTNYEDIYNGIYENIAGNTTITGLNFRDFLVLDKKIDKKLGLAGEYDVFDIKVVNPHRWEIAKLAVGDFEITEKIDAAKRASHVYYIDSEGVLKEVDFKQTGDKVSFKMSSLSLYPVVIEYSGETRATIDEVTSSIIEVDENSATAKVTVKGTSLPEELFYKLAYKKAAGEEEPAPEVDNKILNVKVVDEAGNPVSGVELYLKSTEYEGFGDVKFQTPTDADGRTSYQCDKNVFNDDLYELQPTADNDYTCELPIEVVFGGDGSETYIDTVDGTDYTGEVTLVVKKVKSEEPAPEPTPEVDNTVLKVKVVDADGKPISGVPLYLKSTEYGEFADVDFSFATDGEGKTSYECDDAVVDDDVYELQPKANSDYICESPKKVAFGIDENWKSYVSSVDDNEYTGQITLVVKKSGSKAATVLASISESDTALTDWIPVGGYKEIQAKGTENERTFEVTLPLSEYPDALKWTVGVAVDKESAEGEGYILPAEDMDVEEYITETENALNDLKRAIEKAEEHKKELNEADYTAESWNAYSNAIKSAKSLAENGNAAKDEYLGAIKAIEDAASNLAKKAPAPVDTSVLEKALKEAKAVDGSQYTKESFEVLEKAIESAMAVLNSPDATQDAVDAQVGLLRSALDGLKKISNPDNSDNTNNPDNTGAKTDGTSGNNGGKPNGGNGKAPLTGDSTSVLPFAISIFASMTVILAIILKRKRFK